MDFIEYVQLAFNNTDIQLKRLNSASNYMKLHATGYIYNGLIGETQNKLTLQYRYKLKNDTTAEWSELKIIETTLNDDNTFIIDNLQLEDEFDYRENYDIEFYANDLFLSTDYRTVIKTSETIAKWHKKGAYIKEISASKINLNKVDLFAPSYCMMRTSGKINFDSGNRLKITGMGAGWEVGDYYIEDNDIVVSNTTVLEMSSVLAGYGAVNANIQVYTEDTYYSSSSGCLLEGYGRGYFRIKGETFTLQLDPTKTYRVSLWASGYNDKKFEMNNGFGDKSTQLFVRKIL